MRRGFEPADFSALPETVVALVSAWGTVLAPPYVDRRAVPPAAVPPTGSSPMSIPRCDTCRGCVREDGDTSSDTCCIT